MAQDIVEIYELSDPSSGEVRYIGKAIDSQKRFKSHIREGRNLRRRTPIYCWINSLLSDGSLPVLKVVATIPAAQWEHEERARIFEARLIHPRLLNLADGGNEPKCTKEVRRENARKMQSHPNTIAQRKINGEKSIERFRNGGNYQGMTREDLIIDTYEWTLRHYAKRGRYEKCLELAEKMMAMAREQPGFYHRWEKITVIKS